VAGQARPAPLLLVQLAAAAWLVFPASEMASELHPSRRTPPSKRKGRAPKRGATGDGQQMTSRAFSSDLGKNGTTDER